MCTVLSSYLNLHSPTIVAAKDIRTTWLHSLKTAAGMSRARVLACAVAPTEWLRPISIVMCTESLAALHAELL